LRRWALIALAAAVTGLVVGVVIASSGGDDSGTTTHSVPELSPPPGSISGDAGGSGATGEKGATGESTETAPTQTQTQTTPTQPNGGAAPPPSDTERHDVPPPKGSPAQRFEEFCKQNPGAC
jgi:hypothetical protein